MTFSSAASIVLVAAAAVIFNAKDECESTTKETCISLAEGAQKQANWYCQRFGNCQVKGVTMPAFGRTPHEEPAP
jgi:hypothetical protein